MTLYIKTIGISFVMVIISAASPAFAETTNPYLQKIVWCESGGAHYWQSSGMHDGKYHHKGQVKCGDDGVSCGIGQFSKTTFAWMSHRLGFHYVHWLNARDQLEVMNAALNAGMGKHWSCWWKVVLHKKLVVKWVNGKKHYFIRDRKMDTAFMKLTPAHKKHKPKYTLAEIAVKIGVVNWQTLAAALRSDPASPKSVLKACNRKSYYDLGEVKLWWEERKKR